MTSEASPRFPSPPPVPISVKARAQEIEARSGTPGKGFIPKSSPPVAPPTRTLQHTGSQESTTFSSLTSSPLRSITESLSPGPSRRCSEGDIFLRCKPRPPPVAPKQRRVSLEQGTLPAVPERRTTLSRVLENSHPAPASVCQTENTSNFASFTNAVESGVTCRAEAADGFSPAIFSRSLPASSATTKQPQSPLDDIITSLEKICDEFTLPEKVSKRPERVGRRYTAVDSYQDSSSYQRGNDDVFEKKQATSNSSQQTTGGSSLLNHSWQSPSEHAGSRNVLGPRGSPLKPSEYEISNNTFEYVNPTFVQDDDEESEPVIYRSTLQFTPKPPDRHAVSATLQVSSPKLSSPYRVERSASSCSDNHSAGFYQNFQSKDSSDNNTTWRKSNDVQTTVLDRSSGDLQIQTVRSDQRQVFKKDDKHRDEACPTSGSDSKLKKPVVASKPELPKVLTSSLVSQDTDYLRLKDKKAHDGTRRDSSPSEELEIVKNILANLDFDKYKRRASLETDRKAFDMEEKSPKPPRAQKSGSGKFKDHLLDLLKPNSESPKNPKYRPLGIIRSSSFSNAEENAFLEDREKAKELLQSPKKISTLPRGKSKAQHQPIMKVTSPPAVPAVASCPSIVKLESRVSKSDTRNPDAAHDEGLVSDSEVGPGAYVTAYVSYMTSSLPSHSSGRPGHFRSASDNVTSATSLLIPEVRMKKTSSAERLWSTVSSRLNGTEKRKRRKGIGSQQPDGSTVQSSPVKSGTGRSLTYPPQRKSSTSEEEQEYSSVDSNGLKSLKLLTTGLMGSDADAVHLQSDLSLADSHLCPSEGTVDETYQDVVDSVMHSPSETQYLSVDDQSSSGNNKPHKKKHHSDPGGEAYSPTSGDGFMTDTIGSSRSEPELGGNDTLTTISSSCSSASSETSSRATQTPHQSDDLQHPQLKLVIDAHVSKGGQGYWQGRATSSGSWTSGAITNSRFLFPDLDSSSQRLAIENNPASKSPQEQRRYSKRRLRGPYGEMLEEEMRKSGEKQKAAYSDLSFLQEISESRLRNQDASTATEHMPQQQNRPTMFVSSQSLDDDSTASSRNELAMCVTPKRKISANYPLLTDGEHVPIASDEELSSAKLTPEAPLAKLDKVLDDDSTTDSKTPSQETVKSEVVEASGQDSKVVNKNWDTRTHVVYEIVETERSYVESLQTLVNYMGALKSADYSGVVEGGIVDEIFFQIPEILNIHELFLDGLQKRCKNWEIQFTIGDIFIESFAKDEFTKQVVIDTYTAFINNWKCAKDATKIATQAKPAFARFLEHMSREHKGKLALDALLIMPVQRIPRYELLIKELLKHTNMDHPDHHLLVQAQKEVHDLAVKINRVEREAYQVEQMQQRVRDIEQHIEGVVDLCIPDRAFIRHDVVTIPGGLGTRKERCLFLFSDILLITSIKRKSTAIRKPSTAPSTSTTTSPSQTPFTVLESNKYKLLTRFSLDSMEISKGTDVNVKKAMKDIEALDEDLNVLAHIRELVGKLTVPHQVLDDVVRDLSAGITKQILDKQNNDSSLITVELTVTTPEHVDNLTIQFPSPERRAVWSAAFTEAKLKLGRNLPPELKKALPIRKTRAGLQFTCAAATLGCNQQGLREVWVCNSDGYVGQVCVLSLLPEPTVMSCNGVCNARILTIVAVPATCSMISDKCSPVDQCSPVAEASGGISIEVEEVVEESNQEQTNNGNIQLDSDSSDDEDNNEVPDDEKIKDEHRKRGNSIPREDGQDDMDYNQATMWLGTEDGFIHVYHSSDNIRTKKNKIKFQHNDSIHCLIYFENQVFVALSNGDVFVYERDPYGGWSTSEPTKIKPGVFSAPVTAMLAVEGKMWCGCQNLVNVLKTDTLEVEHTFPVSNDPSRQVLCMVVTGLGVYTVVTSSAIVRLYHAKSYVHIMDINVAPIVTKTLTAATDDIIKQHKSACLRITAMLTCKDLLWIGTSAGVILTVPIFPVASNTTTCEVSPTVIALPHGHTGHVRFLTCVEATPGAPLDPAGNNKGSVRSTKSKENVNGRRASTSAASTVSNKLLVISGGDGYEDFSSSSGLNEQAGHDDSTNHLLLWYV
ncbi:rho guanine nucleotide exchange factor 17-like isoform X2 [Argiope bruennichi]|uniref:rho guanine nucleotide exchange factor 17-like isoform X2 n=1 Tax=Argiope bruennichi TaxID=94029 RepID=UPI002494A3CA|nr:rho guanine nucleotide exchange factor 17-like isoform X2 [Argiope bruennichi]